MRQEGEFSSIDYSLVPAYDIMHYLYFGIIAILAGSATIDTRKKMVQMAIYNIVTGLKNEDLPSEVMS